MRAIERASWRLGCAHDQLRSARRSLARRRLARRLAAPAASRRTKHGITPSRPRRARPSRPASAPTFKVQRQGRGPGLGPRLQVQEEGQRRRDLRTTSRSGRPRSKGSAVPATSRRSSTSPVLAQHARHLLLAGLPHRLRGRRPRRLPPGGPGRQVQGRVVPRMRPVHIGCSGWNYRDWREARSTRRGCRSGAGSSTTRRCSTPSRSTRTFYRLAKPDGGRALGEPDAAGLRVRGQGEPLPDPHEAPDRPGRSGVARFYERDRAAGRVAASSARCCGSCPANFQRDDDRLADALEHLPAGPPLLRVPPRVLVHRRRSTRSCARYGAALVIRRPPASGRGSRSS